MAERANQISVLEDVRGALGRTAPVVPEPLEPFTETLDEAGPDSILERFTREVQAVRGAVHVSNIGNLFDTILEICANGSGEVALSGASLLNDLELGAKLTAQGQITFSPDGVNHEELIARLEGAVAGITCVDYALAETGTLALSSDETAALLVSLLPPVHIAIVRRSQIYSTLEEVIDRLGHQLVNHEAAGRSVSFITGPSRTSDVELVLSIGVHGPKELHVILIE